MLKIIETATLLFLFAAEVICGRKAATVAQIRNLEAVMEACKSE